MRLVTLILAILTILAGGALALLRVGVNFKHADKMKKYSDIAEELTTKGRSKVKETVDKYKTEKMGKKEEGLKNKMEDYRKKHGLARYGGIMMVVCGGLGVVLLLVTLLKLTSLVYLGGILLVLCSIATILINPDYRVGSLEAASARTASYMVTLPIMFGALMAMLSEKLRDKKSS